LLAVSIFLVLTIFSVGLIASFLSQLNAEELRKACSVVLGLVIFVGGAWSYFQLNDGGFQQLINDLKKKDKHDEK
jgi:hypothetical protein